MLNLGTSVNSQIATKVIGGVWLVEMFFASGTQRLTNWPLSLTYGANTYTGLGTVGSVGNLTESEANTDKRTTLTLSPVRTELLALALGNVEGYRGKPVNIYLWAIGDNYQPVGNPLLRFFGVMDQVSVKRNAGQSGEVTGSIEMTCLPGGADSTRKGSTLRMNNAQHQSRHPGERGFEYVNDLLANEQVWLSKNFQAA